MRRLLPLPLLVALTLALFGAWLHWAVLSPTNVGWLLAGDDRGQNALGLAAYLRAGHWPSLREPLLDSPDGAGLLFTDSVPLLGLLLGPVARWLPAGVQVVGAWLLACVALQVGFAWALVRRHAPSLAAALPATALLAAMPALFNRYGHASLCAQWLILWALWVYRDPGRSRAPGWWAAVLGVAGLVHAYLLVMAAAVWGGALLRLAGRRDPAVVGVLALPAAAVAAVLWWHGALAGPFVSTGSYGAFPAALDAWWNPANPGYAALLPATPDRDGRGYEGLNYLGAGLLALVALAVARRVAGGRLPAAGVPLGWLVPGFTVLLVVAVGPQPWWRGAPLFTWHPPTRLVDALDPVRAAGRLVWPATYAIAYAALAAALRRSRAELVLAAALAVQAVDLAPMLRAVRATSARADDPRSFHRTRDPRWGPLVARARLVEVEPAQPFADLALAQEVGWRAVLACRPLAWAYTARETPALRARVAREAAAFRAGRLDPTRLYVLLDGRVPPGLARHVTRLDGVAVIAPAAPAPPPACATSSSPRSAS